MIVRQVSPSISVNQVIVLTLLMRHTPWRIHFPLLEKGANQRSKKGDCDGKEQLQERMPVPSNQLKGAPHASFLQFQHQPHRGMCYSGT